MILGIEIRTKKWNNKEEYDVKTIFLELLELSQLKRNIDKIFWKKKNIIRICLIKILKNG